MSDPNEMIDAFESAGYEPRCYSGRYMYGKQCVAVDMPSTVGMLELGYALGQQSIDPSEFGEARTDNMGMGIIIYWPAAEWPEGRYQVETWTCKECGAKNREADAECNDCGWEKK